LRALFAAGWIKSAHDCSEGGLAVCVAESCMSQRVARGASVLIGAEIDLAGFAGTRLDALLFGETQGRVVISATKKNAPKILAEAQQRGVTATQIGVVKGQTLKFKTPAGNFAARVATLHEFWWSSIAKAME
jgi:phosphoribosylformylglycinamidine synthase